MIVGERIRHLREKQGMSQAALAGRSGPVIWRSTS